MNWAALWVRGLYEVDENLGGSAWFASHPGAKEERQNGDNLVLRVSEENIECERYASHHPAMKLHPGDEDLSPGTPDCAMNGLRASCFASSNWLLLGVDVVDVLPRSVDF
jgi:hypothetical protein